MLRHCEWRKNYFGKTMMDLNQKGWLKTYLDHLELPKEIKEISEREAYEMFQSSGLFYGVPISYFKHSNFHVPEEKSSLKAKLILIDAYLNLNKGDLKHIEVLQQLYIFISNEESKASKFHLKKLEKRIEEQLEIKGTWYNQFWLNQLQNALIFIDVYLFHQFLEHDLTLSSVHAKKEQINFQLLQLLICAIVQDGVMDEQEEKLYEYFEKSAHLPKWYRKKLKQEMEEGISLESIDFSVLNESWILGRFCIELVLILFQIDGHYDVEERKFTLKLMKLLHLKEEDLQEAYENTQMFLFNYWDELPYRKGNFHFAKVYESYQLKVLKSIKENKESIIKEVQQSKELMALLRKSRKGPLSKREKIVMKEQLQDLAKTLPAIGLFILPGGSILFPLLLKIIPKQALLPSAFIDKDLED